MSTEIVACTSCKEDEVSITWKIERFSEVNFGSNSVINGPKFDLPVECCTKPVTPWLLFLHIGGEQSPEIFFRAATKDVLSDFRFRLNYTISIHTSDQEKQKITESSFILVKSFEDYIYVRLGRISDLETNKMINNDVLVLNCRFGVVRCSTTVDLFPVEQSEKHLSSLSENLKSLYSSKAFTDFTIMAGSEQFPVHKCLLSSRSPIFAAMLAGETVEASSNKMEIKDIDAKIVKAMISYLYTGQLDNLTPDMYVQLYSASDKYALESLKKACTCKIIRNLCLDNVCDAYVIGFYHNDNVLKAGAKKYILKSISSVMLSENWRTMVKENNQVATEILKEAGIL